MARRSRLLPSPPLALPGPFMGKVFDPKKPPRDRQQPGAGCCWFEGEVGGRGKPRRNAVGRTRGSRSAQAASDRAACSCHEAEKRSSEALRRRWIGRKGRSGIQESLLGEGRWLHKSSHRPDGESRGLGSMQPRVTAELRQSDQALPRYPSCLQHT